MRRFSAIAAMASSAMGLVFAPSNARAISLPDNSSPCNQSANPCLTIANTGTNDGIRASSNGTGNGLFGSSQSGDGVRGSSANQAGVRGSGGLYGVYGFGSTGNYGVYGFVSTTGVGVTGYAGTGNGVVGQNTRTDFNAAAISALSGDSQNGLAIYAGGAIQVSSSIAQKSGGSTWQTFSDARLKRDVHPLELGLEELLKVRPVTFKYNGLGGTKDDGTEFVGVLAQDLEKIFPSMVTSRKGKLRPTDDKETDIKIVDPNAFTFIMIHAMKEQQEIIDRQGRQIAALQGQRSSLSASLLGNGIGLVLGLSLIPFGFIALRRRRPTNRAS